MKIDMTIWDNDTTTAEKQEILLFCEHALNRAWNDLYSKPVQIKYDRWFAGFTAEITGDVDLPALVKSYNRRLNHFAPWRELRDGEEVLVMEIEWGRA